MQRIRASVYYKCQTINFSENRTISQIKHFFDHVQHTEHTNFNPHWPLWRQGKPIYSKPCTLLQMSEIWTWTRTMQRENHLFQVFRGGPWWLHLWKCSQVCPKWTFLYCHFLYISLLLLISLCDIVWVLYLFIACFFSVSNMISREPWWTTTCLESASLPLRWKPHL